MIDHSYVTQVPILLKKKLKLLLNVGLFKLEIGIQTGSEDMNRKLYNRSISNTTTLKTAQIINKYITKMDYPNYQFLFCNPYETEKDLIETVTLIQKLPYPFFVQTFPFQFFPATKLHKKAQYDGLLKKEIINLHCHEKALELNNKERYLNLLVCLMKGLVTSKTMKGLIILVARV